MVSPVFRHGRLRLYLLKLLDEAPRHGYEVIRLLQDRFLGVYSPSPGTIYPRLARLEEEGLVTHDDADGKKTYRITEKGREEIRARMDDLAELEEELTESVRDIAREVTQDVRDTVRNLREELTWAARDVRREGRERAGHGGTDTVCGAAGSGTAGSGTAGSGTAGGGTAGGGTAGGGTAGGGTAGGGTAGGGTAQNENPAGRPGARAGQPHAAQPQDEARGIREEARRAREQMREAFRSQRGGGARDRGGWQNWAAAWREGPWPAGPRPGGDSPPWASFRPEPGGQGQNAGLLRDLERMAVEFASELRAVSWHAESIGENAAGQLRSILEDALTRIKDEVFRGPAGRPADESGDDAGSETAPRGR